MMLIAIHNVDVFMIEETQCSGNGFPCMAESQVAFSKEKIVGQVQLVPQISTMQFYCIELLKGRNIRFLSYASSSTLYPCQ